MSYQAVFQRYEMKYLITRKQQETLLNIMQPYMALDQYGRTTINNIYYDTDNYRLIRRSIEKPAYKEKLRIRSYGRAADDSQVFVELKKKFNDVVYKRRISLPWSEAVDWISGRTPCSHKTQISAEIEYFLEYYQTLHPTVLLSYEREAYYSLDGSDFRVTFDDHLLCRQQNLNLQSEIWGIPLMDDDRILMEIKCSGGIPLWMVHALSREHIYKTSFSKYGTAYQSVIFPMSNRLCFSPINSYTKEVTNHEYNFSRTV